jgi:hypothetical protein
MDYQQEINDLKREKNELQAQLLKATGERELAIRNEIAAKDNLIAAYVTRLPMQAAPAGTLPLNIISTLTSNLLVVPSFAEITSVSFPDVGENRKRRWQELNSILDKKSKSKPKNQGEKSTVSYSNVSWNDIKPVYQNISSSMKISEKPIREETFISLKTYLSIINTSVKDLSGKEAKRMFYIVPIVAAVCHEFDGEVEILVEDDIDGNRIHANGHFEMVLKKGSKRICIVEAKKDDIDQGRAQCLLGCEAVSDIERTSIVCGIITSYEIWELAISKDDCILEEHISTLILNGMMTDDSLRLITGKIYCLLSDESF